MAAHHSICTNYHPSVKFAALPAGPLDNGRRFLARESLGSNTIDDLNVVGTRETLTINAGGIGNNQPVVTTGGFWYSSALEINLSVTRKDPREGSQVLQIVELSRSDRDPSLFQVPADFTVQDTRASAKTEN